MPSTDEATAAEARWILEGLLSQQPEIADRLPAAFPAAIERFVALLLAANRQLNLTRVTVAADVARVHLLDSLAALPAIDAIAPVKAIDLGSGGGLPALPLALARPALRWTLVDSVAKKAAVLAGFAHALELNNVSVIAQRAEVLGRSPSHRERYDLATARACAALPVLAELGLPLLAVGGSLVAWKGPLTERDDEVQRGRRAIGQLGGDALRILDPGVPALGGHRLVIVTKEHPTDPRYPRRPGEPARRPLG